MGKVGMYASVSVDGFLSDENDQPGPLFDWLSSGDVPLDESGEGFQEWLQALHDDRVPRARRSVRGRHCHVSSGVANVTPPSGSIGGR